MMIAASTIALAAIAMPPSDMIFALSPCPNMIRKDESTATARITIATNALRSRMRKRAQTSAMTKLSSSSFSSSVFTARSMRAVRS